MQFYLLLISSNNTAERYFRNQQVAGSIPAGGSIESITSGQAALKLRFNWVQLTSFSELGILFSIKSSDSTATLTLSGTDWM